MKRIVSVFAILVVAISFCNSFAQSIEGSWATTKKGEDGEKIQCLYNFQKDGTCKAYNEVISPEITLMPGVKMKMSFECEMNYTWTKTNDIIEFTLKDYVLKLTEDNITFECTKTETLFLMNSQKSKLVEKIKEDISKKMFNKKERWTIKSQTIETMSVIDEVKNETFNFTRCGDFAQLIIGTWSTTKVDEEGTMKSLFEFKKDGTCSAHYEVSAAVTLTPGVNLKMSFECDIEYTWDKKDDIVDFQLGAYTMDFSEEDFIIECDKPEMLALINPNKAKFMKGMKEEMKKNMCKEKKQWSISELTDYTLTIVEENTTFNYVRVTK